MHEQWMLSLILLHTLFHPEYTESSIVCEDEKKCGCLNKDGNVKIKRVYENSTAIIPCPNLQEDEKLISASLYKGKSKMHFADMVNIQELSEKFQVSKQNYSISYRIHETKSNDTGIYICTIQTQIGQEKRKEMKDTNTILLVKDAQQSTEPSEDPCPLRLIFYSLLYFAIAYDLIITVICVLVYKFKKKKQPENPYMNTRRGRHRLR
ncbi:hypothetical protein E1301_Tti012856 [Triplophysa tibetana]|uniref:Immunoglobulin subtype domain-containing protein n=1 Tax=Triplophysa tibetana TaxID=1572043 RepID=A0A5A9P2C2_9TELE|nr:hypothetical protein E1301_Tti012856 [Triplophysa tibetana]